MNKDMRVGVLLGGLSTERGVSLKSGAAVAAVLRERGWDVVEIDVGRDLPRQLIQHRVDVAWLALHGRFGEDGCVQGLLEVMGIPYTGSGVRASAVAMDKIATKRALASALDLVMAQDVVWREGDPRPDLLLPVVVKPSVGGSTLGIHFARTEDELSQALAKAAALHPEVLVEEYIQGDEITVAVVDDQALPVVAIVPDSGFFDYAAKYEKGRTQYIVPAPIPESVALRARAGALAAHRGLGCQGLTRSDFLIRADGTPVFLEINTLPGMTATSLSPMAAAEAGMDFGDLVERLLMGAHKMEPED